MSGRDRWSDHRRRMHVVLEFMDRHLDGPIDLAAAASVANFSPFHFHRVFAAWVGETPGDYLRRRRLEIAAMRLITQPRSSVLDVALAVGFGSAEAFARAFRSRFGCTPTAWRRSQAAARVGGSAAGGQAAPADPNVRPGGAANRTVGQTNRNPGQVRRAAVGDHGALVDRMRSVTVDARLVDRGSVRVAYLRHLGPYGEDIARFWQERVYAWLARDGLLDRPRYGISWDDPGVTAPELCRYDACVEVPADYAAAGEVLITTLPGGRYAVLAFRGTADGIGDAWSALLRDWLPSTGLQLDARPCFEYYPQGKAFDPATGAFECDICVPVTPLR
jgi:AraC family transcriptional regulator